MWTDCDYVLSEYTFHLKIEVRWVIGLGFLGYLLDAQTDDFHTLCWCIDLWVEHHVVFYAVLVRSQYLCTTGKEVDLLSDWKKNVLLHKGIFHSVGFALVHSNYPKMDILLLLWGGTKNLNLKDYPRLPNHLTLLVLSFNFLLGFDSDRSSICNFRIHVKNALETPARLLYSQNTLSLAGNRHFLFGSGCVDNRIF